jgi:uncharacterized protein
VGYLMVLRQNDSVLGQLANFAQAEKIPSANFTGMGFVDITFGFFDFETKKYKPRDFKHVELVSLHGTIAWKKDSTSIHAHGVVADKAFHFWWSYPQRNCWHWFCGDLHYGTRQAVRTNEG